MNARQMCTLNDFIYTHPSYPIVFAKVGVKGKHERGVTVAVYHSRPTFTTHKLINYGRLGLIVFLLDINVGGDSMSHTPVIMNYKLFVL